MKFRDGENKDDFVNFDDSLNGEDLEKLSDPGNAFEGVKSNDFVNFEEAVNFEDSEN